MTTWEVRPVLHGEVIVPGPPIPWARPRVSKHGGFHTSKADGKHRKDVALVARAHLPPRPLEGSVRLDVRFYLPLPSRTTKADRERCLTGHIRPWGKPDVDNLAKSVADALVGVAYVDDKQIVELHAVKFYSVEPRTEILVFGLEMRHTAQVELDEALERLTPRPAEAESEAPSEARPRPKHRTARVGKRGAVPPMLEQLPIKWAG